MATEFDKEYDTLEDEFRKQVKFDCSIWKSSVFLPNMQPSGPVDYLFVGMEPSLSPWAKTPVEANAMIETEKFKNFLFSIEDFILHYCIRMYLCQDGGTYYITDLSKGAMPVNDANTLRRKRYGKWYELFCKEFNIVSHNTTKVICIGTAPRDFLTSKKANFESIIKPRKIELILHYSNQAGKYRKELAELHPEEFKQFICKILKKNILKTAKDILEGSGMSKHLKNVTLQQLNNGRELTISQKQLIFSYKMKFAEYKIK